MHIHNSYVPGSVLSSFHTLPHLILIRTKALMICTIISPILEILLFDFNLVLKIYDLTQRQQ